MKKLGKVILALFMLISINSFAQTNVTGSSGVAKFDNLAALKTSNLPSKTTKDISRHAFVIADSSNYVLKGLNWVRETAIESATQPLAVDGIIDNRFCDWIKPINTGFEVERYNLSLGKWLPVNDVVLADTTALKAYTGNSETVTVNGTSGMGMQFKYVSSGTTDFGTKFTSANGGIYERIYEGMPDVRFWGASTALADNTAKFANAVTYSPTNSLYVSEGTFKGWFRIRKNGFTLKGSGASTTTIQLPANANASSVIELGDLAAGNSSVAYTKINISGFTLDGNKTNQTTPTTDLTDWGLSLTNTTYCNISDITAINCFNGGVGLFIISDYNNVECKVKNCGTGGIAQIGFDINSSDNNICNIDVENCYQGARILDNADNNILIGNIKNSTTNGFILNNQFVNLGNYNNTVNLNIEGGCSNQGAVIGYHNVGNKVNLNIRNTTGFSFNEQLLVNNIGKANTYNIISTNCQTKPFIIGGSFNNYDLTSNFDGLGNSQGANYALDIQGTNNKLGFNFFDKTDATWKLRAISTTSTASNNTLLYYNASNSNQHLFLIPTGGELLYVKGDKYIVEPSASSINLPLGSSSYYISGTTDINSIGAFQKDKGRIVTLIFQSTAKMFSQNNMRLTSYYVGGVAGTSITMWCDGTNWYEISRSENNLDVLESTAGNTTTLRGEKLYKINPATALSSMAVTLPTTPYTGQEFKISIGGTIAAGATVLTGTVTFTGGTTYGDALPNGLRGNDEIIMFYDGVAWRVKYLPYYVTPYSSTAAIPQGSTTATASTTQTVTLSSAPTVGTDPSRFEVVLESGINRYMQYPSSLDATNGYTALTFSGSVVTITFPTALAITDKLYVRLR